MIFINLKTQFEFTEKKKTKVLNSARAVLDMMVILARLVRPEALISKSASSILR